MAGRISRVEKMAEASRRAREFVAEERRKSPRLFVRPEDQLLFVENVAEMLGCGVDYVRRIPRQELPAAKCGARLQYLREDVLQFVRRRRDTGRGNKIDLRAARASGTIPLKAEEFNPVADVRSKLGAGKKQK